MRAGPPTDLKSADLFKQKQICPSACSLPTPMWDIVVQRSATRFSTCPQAASWWRSRRPLRPSLPKGSVDLSRSDFSQIGQPAVCFGGLFQAAQGPCRCTVGFRRGFGRRGAALLRKLVSFSFVAFFKFLAFFDTCCPADHAEDLTLTSVSSSLRTFCVGPLRIFFRCFRHRLSTHRRLT